MAHSANSKYNYKDNIIRYVVNEKEATKEAFLEAMNSLHKKGENLTLKKVVITFDQMQEYVKKIEQFKNSILTKKMSPQNREKKVNKIIDSIIT